MDKLQRLLDGSSFDFAAAFGAASRRVADTVPTVGFPLWMEGWMVPAHAGCVLGAGEFIYKERLCRFHFSGLPLRGGEKLTMHAAGTVTRLHHLSEFNGVYFLDESGESVGTRRARKLLRNESGVVISLTGPDHIRPFNAPTRGLHVRLSQM